MYLYRKKGSIDGVFCSKGYKFKRPRVPGLKPRSYFVTEQACAYLSEKFQGRQRNRRRVKNSENDASSAQSSPRAVSKDASLQLPVDTQSQYSMLVGSDVEQQAAFDSTPSARTTAHVLVPYPDVPVHESQAKLWTRPDSVGPATISHFSSPVYLHNSSREEISRTANHPEEFTSSETGPLPFPPMSTFIHDEAETRLAFPTTHVPSTQVALVPVFMRNSHQGAFVGSHESMSSRTPQPPFTNSVGPSGPVFMRHDHGFIPHFQAPRIPHFYVDQTRTPRGFPPQPRESQSISNYFPQNHLVQDPFASQQVASHILPSDAHVPYSTSQLLWRKPAVFPSSLHAPSPQLSAESINIRSQYLPNQRNPMVSPHSAIFFREDTVPQLPPDHHQQFVPVQVVSSFVPSSNFEVPSSRVFEQSAPNAMAFAPPIHLVRRNWTSEPRVTDELVSSGNTREPVHDGNPPDPSKHVMSGKKK
eukprot:TRINITY_DN22650_c0_g1_i1.p1 TRINITY_DN22650_c0_g1~~TRINITY_DN22650_c0_g1_i1.p1  ORF type:complete len:474 (+),score=62.13 TRINITY_DN22650_c0_g1_i1:73-1494(+)